MKKKEAVKRSTLHFPTQEYEKIKKLSDANDRSPTEVIHDICEGIVSGEYDNMLTGKEQNFRSVGVLREDIAKTKEYLREKNLTVTKALSLILAEVK